MVIFVVDIHRAMDSTIQKEHKKIVSNMSEIYKKQTGNDLVLGLVLTKVEELDKDDFKHIERSLRENMPSAKLIIKKNIDDLSELNNFIMDEFHETGNLSKRINSVVNIRNHCCHNIIWRNAGKVALYSVVPVLDIAMYIILTETVDLLLCALYGLNELELSDGTPLALTALSVAGRGIFLSATILSKVLDASVIFYVVGTAISAAVNSTGVLVSGYLTWSRIKGVVSEKGASNFNNSMTIYHDAGKHWKKIESFTPDSIICIQSGDRWLLLRKKTSKLKRRAVSPNQATRFKVQKDKDDESKDGYLLVLLEMKDKILHDGPRPFSTVTNRCKKSILWELKVPEGHPNDYKGVLKSLREKPRYLYTHKDYLCIDKSDQKHRFIVWQLED
jgi:hypothetical protein